MTPLKRFFRAAAFLLAALLLTLGAFATEPQPSAESESDTAQVLLVCDENKGRAAIEALIRGAGKTVHAVSESDYTALLPQRYGFVVTTIYQPYLDAAAAGIPTVCLGADAGPVRGVSTLRRENFSATLQLGDHSQYTFIEAALLAQPPEQGQLYGEILPGTGERFPFAVLLDSVAYVPWYQTEGLGYIMLGGLLRQYFNGGPSPAGEMYVLLDEIYPFSDLDMLRETADRFYQSGIPFIVRIMPTYDNLDYPAFKRFTQALRYVQSKGGAIVLHDPLVRSYETEREPLSDKLSRAEAALSQEGLVLCPTGAPGVEIALEDLQSVSHPQLSFGRLPIDTMIRFALFEDSSALDDAVRRLDDAWFSFSNYKSEFLQLEVPQYEEKTIETAYVYRQNAPTSLSDFFSGANRILLMVVGVSVFLFLIFIAVGRRIYRRMFYRR